MGTAFRTEAQAIPDLAGARSLRVEGRVSYRDAAGLRQALLCEVGRTTGRGLIVELSSVESIDTAGAAVLVEALHAASRRGLRLLLCSPSASVVKMFRLAGFAEVLDHCCDGAHQARALLED